MLANGIENNTNRSIIVITLYEINLKTLTMGGDDGYEERAL